eukprot:GHVN01041730.1.p1 GENE.GHVN01041730.1~~GHVN01041730.1.p1  ORF type:complete len:433 (+),score=30.89 GHVN01041730.1:32-1300(+)
MLTKLHLLPLECENTVPTATIAKHLLATKQCLKLDNEIAMFGVKYVVVACEPKKGGAVTEDTVLYTRGPPVTTLDSIEFVVVVPDATELFLQEQLENHLVPYLSTSPITLVPGQSFRLKPLKIEFLVVETDKPSTPARITHNTHITLSADPFGVYERVHVVPFSDSVPSAYQIDLFQNCIKPYFLSHRRHLFTVGDIFKYGGCDFKFIAAKSDPKWDAPLSYIRSVQAHLGGSNQAKFVTSNVEDKFISYCATRSSELCYRRVGRSTIIHTAGSIKPTLSSVLPPETVHKLRGLEPNFRQIVLVNCVANRANGDLERVYEERERTMRQRLDPESLRERRLPPSAVEDFSTTPNQGSSLSCLVCLGTLASDDKVAKLPCGHVFHFACVNEWTRRWAVCPTCRDDFSALCVSVEPVATEKKKKW